MNIDEVRRNFSKASIVVSPTRVSALYSNSELSYSESINSEFLADLFEESQRVIIEGKSNSFVKISFDIPTGESGTVIYPISKDQMTLEELRESCAELEPAGPGLEAYLPDNFVELDFSELIPYMQEYTRELEKAEPDVYTDEQQWHRLLDAALKFASYVGAESEILEPNQKRQGIVTVFALEEPREKLTISGNTKSIARAVFLESDEVALEINVEIGGFFFMFGTKPAPAPENEISL